MTRWARLRGRALLTAEPSPEPPIRSSLLSSDQMERHGRTLAASHKVGPGHAPDLLLARLGQNEAVLSDASRLLGAAVRAGQRIEPAGEWLLDNFYLIEEQIR
ncbi:MAG TPA: hypothetical protein VFO95_02315, partial [Gemmatimonadales bacterium]|nr:hypothetical protein [Gemmatimonadales bacterium]